MVDFAAAAEQNRQLLEELKSKQYDVAKLAEEFDSSLGIQVSQLEKRKSDVKKRVIEAHVQRLLLECVTSQPDPNTWPTAHQAEGALEESCERLKTVQQETEEIKTDLQELCEIAEKKYNKVIGKKMTLERKLKELVEKCEALAELQKKQEDAMACSDEVKTSAEIKQLIKEKTEQLERTRRLRRQCQGTCSKVQDDLQRVSSELQQVQSLVARSRSELQQVLDHQQNLIPTASQQCNQVWQLTSDLQSLSGIYLSDVGQDRMTLRLVSEARDSRTMELEVTLVFGSTDGMGQPVLTEVQTNSPSLQADDLMEDPQLRADLPELVTRLKARWQAHVPLLAEMEDLHKRFAVDWIQEENCLRAMVGEGGGIVCTLAIPPTYPLNKNIFLKSIQGVDISDVEKLEPQPGASLQDWVTFLEEKFGKP